MSKVFISYSHKDEDWKDQLKTHLAVLEHQGLLSVWDDRQIAAGDDWYPEIAKAIESAQIAILLISANFLSSKFILGKEVPALLERREKEGLRVIPFILKHCNWQEIPWLAEIQGRPLYNKPLSSFDENNRDYHLSELAREVNELLSSVPTNTQHGLPQNATNPSQPLKANYDPRNPAFLVPFRAKGKFMVGRDAALEKVRQQLLAGKPTSIGQTALFQGIGGLGKTQLAVEYAHHYRDQYPTGIYWITADENIDAQLTKIAVDANWVSPASEHAIKLDVARNRLRTYSDCLIIFDNLESVEAIRDYLPEASANPHILVTSRREQVEFSDVALDLLDNSQSYALLVQEAGKLPQTESEESAAKEIVATLGGLPLALELAGAYLAHRHVGWCEYRDLLLDDLKKALPKQFASPTRHEADLFHTLKISEQGIGEEPLLIEILDLLTWSGSSPMGLPLMAHLLDVKETDLYGALGLGHALRLLQKVSDSKHYAIHRLVQEVRRQDHPLDQHRDWADTVMRRLGGWFEAIRDDFNALPLYEMELEHLRAWQVHAESCSPVSSARLLWLQGYPVYHRGRYVNAARIVELALKVYEIHNADNLLLKAHLMHDLAYCYSLMGDYLRARELGEQALEIRQRLLGDRHPDIADSLDNLGIYHWELGDNYSALKLGNKALEIRQELLGNKHSHIANSLGNLASYHSSLGDNVRALGLNTEALEMRRELLGNKHPNVATALSNLASYYSRLGNYDRALQLGNEALEMLRELLGDKHPAVANSLSNLAGYYSCLGDNARALELGKEALEMRCELLGEKHPDTINSLLFVLKRFYANPRTASQGIALMQRFLKKIPREHPSYGKLLNFVNRRDGFRKVSKTGGSKKKARK